MAQLIDGKAIAKKVREEVRQEVEQITSSSKRAPGLAVIIVGEDPASQVYVRNKGKASENAGFYSQQFTLPADTSQDDLIAKVEELNQDEKVDGILVQLPLPSHLSENDVLNSIHPDKDVDGFHPINVGKLAKDLPSSVPCTPLGVMRMLKEIDLDLKGKEMVVIGRSDIVGKPMAFLGLQKKDGANATVTVCHSGTKDLPAVVKRADVVVAAIGRAKFVTADMVKEGAIVIDVGINRQDDGKLCGDVDFDQVEPIASHITPVPGGVGPMTIAMLLSNTLEAYKRKI